jgi:hypothetical protein
MQDDSLLQSWQAYVPGRVDYHVVLTNAQFSREDSTEWANEIQQHICKVTSQISRSRSLIMEQCIHSRLKDMSC